MWVVKGVDGGTTPEFLTGSRSFRETNFLTDSPVQFWWAGSNYFCFRTHWPWGVSVYSLLKVVFGHFQRFCMKLSWQLAPSGILLYWILWKCMMFVFVLNYFYLNSLVWEQCRSATGWRTSCKKKKKCHPLVIWAPAPKNRYFRVFMKKEIGWKFYEKKAQWLSVLLNFTASLFVCFHNFSK